MARPPHEQQGGVQAGRGGQGGPGGVGGEEGRRPGINTGLATPPPGTLIASTLLLVT